MAGNPWQPGQLLFAGFEGQRVPGEMLEWIGQGRLGGVILFARNLADPSQVRALVRTLTDAAPDDVPLTIAIDQEGGRVQRLRDPWTEWPPMRRIGDVADLETTGRVADALAVELLDLGIGLDLAPVVDIDTNPANPVIGDRSFGRTAAEVVRHSVTMIERMQAQGLAACAKHFPGHGDTVLDSHLALPKLQHDLHRLREVELVPFHAAAQAQVATMMTAHVVFESIDPKRPATLSPDVMALLREEIGYQGLVLSDDLEMKAVADHYKPVEMVSGALRAGVDVILACRDLGLVRECLRLLESQPDAVLESAVERLVAFKRRFPSPTVSVEPFEHPPYPEHRRLAESMR